MAKKILVVAVHPDDETLGAGGTLLKHCVQGDEINWLICTEMRLNEGFSSERIARRKAEIARVAACFGFASVHHLALPTTRVDTFSMAELTARISPIMTSVAPHTIYLPFKEDVHSDHRRIFEAVHSCTKVFRYPFVQRILMMEVLSETEFAPAFGANAFVPNVFNDIAEYIDKKLDILGMYEGEMGAAPFPRSEAAVRALATVRGAAAGSMAAESFMLLKEIM